MNTFKLIVSSPDGHIFNGECVRFDVRGTEGELAIMAGHIPFVTAVVKSSCTIVMENGEKKAATTDGGLLAVSKDTVTFVSGSFKFDDNK